LRFAVRWPGSPEASPRSHGVPRRDVPGRVHVSVTGVSAGRACELRLALARFRIHVPARRAPLTRERGVDPLHPTGSLLLQAPRQQAPSRPQDPPVQSGLLADVPARTVWRALCASDHVPDLQVLDPDHVKAEGQIRGGLLGPVLALVPFPGTQPSDRVPHPPTAVGAWPRRSSRSPRRSARRSPRTSHTGRPPGAPSQPPRTPTAGQRCRARERSGSTKTAARGRDDPTARTCSSASHTCGSSR
jgi:hypothetical protein